MRSARTCLAKLPVLLITAAAASGFQQTESFKLLPADGDAGDHFGYSVAIGGGLAIVGAPYDDDFYTGVDSGSAHLFDPATGAMLLKLTAADAWSYGAFGTSVALGKGVALVGAPGASDSGAGSGSAYLFDTATGHEKLKLKAPDGRPGASFGGSVALYGNLALVGAEGHDLEGAAYLMDTTTGKTFFQFRADDGATGDLFGWSVALNGSIVVIGAPADADKGLQSGSAYVFDLESGAELFKLTAFDGVLCARFGCSVAVNETFILIGARGDDAHGSSSGAAYLYDAKTGKLLRKLTAYDGASFEYFGSSVALSGGTALVGSCLHANRGSAYMFDLESKDKPLQLRASDGAPHDLFGYSVSIDDETALVGAMWTCDNGDDSGSAYLFER